MEREEEKREVVGRDGEVAPPATLSWGERRARGSRERSFHGRGENEGEASVTIDRLAQPGEGAAQLEAGQTGISVPSRTLGPV